MRIGEDRRPERQYISIIYCFMPLTGASKVYKRSFTKIRVYSKSIVIQYIQEKQRFPNSGIQQCRYLVLCGDL